MCCGRRRSRIASVPEIGMRGATSCIDYIAVGSHHIWLSEPWIESQDLSQLFERAYLLADQAPGASLKCTPAVLLGRLRGDIHIICYPQLSSSESQSEFEGVGRGERCRSRGREIIINWLRSAP